MAVLVRISVAGRHLRVRLEFAESNIRARCVCLADGLVRTTRSSWDLSQLNVIGSRIVVAAMASNFERASSYRSQAAQIAARAVAVQDPYVRDRLLDIAGNYLRIAERIEMYG